MCLKWKTCTKCTPSQNGRCKNVEGALQSGTNALSVQSCAREPGRVGNGEGTGGTCVEVAEVASIDGSDGEGIGSKFLTMEDHPTSVQSKTPTSVNIGRTDHQTFCQVDDGG